MAGQQDRRWVVFRIGLTNEVFSRSWWSKFRWHRLMTDARSSTCSH